MVEKSHTAGFWPNIYEPFRQMGQRVADWFAPASDASVDEDAYRISIELPGVAEQDIDVSVHDGVVTVKGEKYGSREETGETWFFTERQFGSFSRAFRLPADADGDKIAAHLRDGVLEVTIPKHAPGQTQGRKVEIRRG